jgi:2,4-dienoyl-CoA reductase-like NADH-dependent reductase (Old Yellow Enzyme family)
MSSRIDPFAPSRLGPITLRNRLVKAATYEHMARDGLVTDALIDFHVAFGTGGVGMTTVAYCAVSPDGRIDGDQLLWTERAAAGMQRLTEAVHATGAAISAQIGHAGPVNDPRKTGTRQLAPSRLTTPASFSVAKSADAADLARVIAAHGDAALMAADVGFDAVEVHLAHNYLVSSFLSPKLNKRRDEYGGSLEHRARLAREVMGAVRDRVGSRIAILAKLSMDDGVPGGFELAESIQVARWLEQDGTVDAIELTEGSSLLNPMYLFRGDVPLRDFAAAMPRPLRLGVRLFGKKMLREYPYAPTFLLDDARQIRDAVDLPLVLLGGVTDLDGVTRGLESGFDFVALGRALLRQPDLPKRMQEDPAHRSLCTHCNRCMPTIFDVTHCVLVAPDERPGWRTKSTTNGVK